MIYDDIIKTVKRLIRKYGERNPFKLCDALDIKLCPHPLGNEDTAIKAFYKKICRIKVIVLNSDLPKVMQRYILSHEIGHAVLHKDGMLHASPQFTLFDESSVCEKEANLFAAEYLLDDDEVLKRMNEDYTFSMIASDLYVPVELLDFKYRLMNAKGYKLPETPVIGYNGFLRNVTVPSRVDWM